MQGNNGLKWHHRRSRLDIRKNFLRDRVAKHCNRLPGEVVGFPCLEVFQRFVAVTLRDMG